MKKIVRKGFFLVAMLLCASLVFTACGRTRDADNLVELVYDDYLPKTEAELAESKLDSYGGMKFPDELFFKNDLDARGADPFVLYVSKEDNSEYGGYYYLYYTSNSARNFNCYRSTDLQNWTSMGVAFEPETGSYIIGTGSDVCYAPEVYYDAEEELYFMYFSASHADYKEYIPENPEDDEEETDEAALSQKQSGHTIALATSETPFGPFKQVVRENEDMVRGLNTDSNKLRNPFIDPVALKQNLKESDPNYSTHYEYITAIDAHVYSEGTKKYLYFSVTNPEENYVAALELTDWYTPDYSTFKQITENGRYFVTQTEGDDVTQSDEVDYEVASTINEGPFILKNGDKYYLTLSVYGWQEKQYSVIQAVSDSPMGPFAKLKLEDGGLILSAGQGAWDNLSGTGHHSFIKAGDELLIYYHAHLDRRQGGNSVRGFAFDRVKWVQNSKGETVMYVNGPTWSLQPQLEINSQYKNIAADATITATNAKEGSDAKFLNDGLLSLYDFADYVGEFKANAGKTEITLSFNDYRTITGLMIYNSKNYYNAFQKIARIEFDFKDGETEATAFINNLGFDWDFYKQTSITEMRPGGSAVASFNELSVKTIRITLDTELPDGTTAADFAVAVSEIVVLGK